MNAPIREVFKLFTERFGDFKLREHNLLQAPIAETVFQPRVGGNLYDRAVDGIERLTRAHGIASTTAPT